MSRRLRVTSPPPTGTGLFTLWAKQVTDAINGLPNFSMSSVTNGPESNVTASPGTLLINIASSGTVLWVKTSGTTTTGWHSVDFT